MVFRTSDRPRYAGKCMERLRESLSPGVPIVVVHNHSSHEQHTRTYNAIAECGAWDVDPHRRVLEVELDKPVGGPEAINQGVEAAIHHFGIDQVVVVDDDVVVPNPLHRELLDGSYGMLWFDAALASMLDGGWDVAGIVGAWARAERVWLGLGPDHPKAGPARDKGGLECIGGVWGFRYRHVSGGCSAFPTRLWHQQSIPGGFGGYTEWIRSQRNVGYYVAHPLGFLHIDRIEHPWSERDGEYAEFSDRQYWERFPDRAGQRRPVGDRL